MSAKKSLALLLSVSMIFSMVSLPAFAVEGQNTAVPISSETNSVPTTTFSDTADHWAAKAIDRWSGYGVVKGNDKGAFRPNDNLSRGELAMILSSLLGLTEAPAENPYADLKGDEWYAEAILKCTSAGIIKGDGTNCSATAPISRQESVVMLARALGIKPAVKADLSAYTDGASVADWAAGYLTVMSKSGIVQGVSAGVVAPSVSISRASVMTILDKAISDYISVGGTYDKLVGTGIVVVTAPDVVLKSNTISGSLLVAEGVGNGTFTLDGTKVIGNTTVRGGGVNSFVVMGGSALGDVTIARVDGAVRIVTSGGSTIATTYIDDGKDDVIMEGQFGNVSVGGDVPVTLKGADVKTVTATGKDANITVDKNSKVETVATAQENTTITVAGTVTNVAATEKAAGVNLTVSKGGTTANVTTAAPGSTITVAGTVTNLAATKEAAGVNMNVSAGGSATNVITAAPNSTISNDGKMGTVSLSKDATAAKIVVGEKSTMDKIVSENKANLTVTTAAAEAAAKAEAAAQAAAEKAAADKLAADKAAATAQTAEAKAAAEAAQKAAAAAAEKAAAEKAAAEKTTATEKAAADKVAADAEKKTENKPVVVPEAPKVDEGGSGTIVIPEAPAPAPSVPEAKPDTKPTPAEAAQAALRDSVLASVGAINARLSPLATLSVSANVATVAIPEGKTTAKAVFEKEFLKEFFAHPDIVSVQIAGSGTNATVTGLATSQGKYEEIMAHVAHAAGLVQVDGTTPISTLKGKSVEVTLNCKAGDVAYSVTYTVNFS